MEQYVQSSHMRSTLIQENLRSTTAKIVKALKEFDKEVPFDAIAFRGMSGAMLAGILSYRLKKDLLLVRKPEDSTHSPYKVEGNHGAEKYVIVDDIVSSGATVKNIVQSIYKECGQSRAPKIVGIMMYLENVGVRPIREYYTRYQFESGSFSVADPNGIGRVNEWSWEPYVVKEVPSFQQDIKLLTSGS